MRLTGQVELDDGREVAFAIGPSYTWMGDGEDRLIPLVAALGRAYFEQTGN